MLISLNSASSPILETHRATVGTITSHRREAIILE